MSSHDQARASSRPSSSRCWALLGAVSLIGLAVRLVQLSRESLWLDEGSSLHVASLGLRELLPHLASVDNHPPLYFLILHFWVGWFGSSEFAVRLPSVLFGWLTILVIYRVAALLFSENVGWLAALVLALSPFHVSYSQEARMYSLMALLTLLSMYFFVRMEKEPGLGIFVGHVILSTLLVYTHVYGLFILAAQNAYVGTMLVLSRGCKDPKGPTARAWVIDQAVVAALYAPWVASLLTQMSGYRRNVWLGKPTVVDLYLSFYEYAGSTVLLCLFLGLAVLGIVTIRGERRDSPKPLTTMLTRLEAYSLILIPSNLRTTYLLLAWLLLPLALPFLISQFWTPIYLRRGTIGASLALYLLAASGMEHLRTRPLKAALVGLVIVLSSLSLIRYSTTLSKEDWRGVAQHLDQSGGLGDLVLVHADWCLKMLDYYSSRNKVVRMGLPRGTSVAEIAPRLEPNHRIWLIVCNPKEPPGIITTVLKTPDSLYELKHRRPYNGVDLLLFERAH